MSDLRFDNVTVRFGSPRHGLTALDAVSLTVPDGAVVGLVGESGSGKSTLARVAVGLAPLQSGRILLDGEPVPHRGRRRPLQMIFQDPYSSLDPRMTIGESIAEAIPPGTSRADRRREVARLLELVHFDAGRAGAYPAQLSGGQRQRIAIARALAGRPRVVIADEITSALDVSIQGAVLNLVRDLQQELGLSMLFISHNLAVVRYVASHIAVMYLGRIVEFAPTAEVLADPQHPYTRELLAASPGSEAGRALSEHAVATEPADPHHPPPGCRYHPICRVGPSFLPERAICRTADPSLDHLHEAACHFARPAGSGADDPFLATATPSAEPTAPTTRSTL